MSHATWNQNPSTEELKRSYDEIPYPNPPKPFTQISRLAALASRRGLPARDVRHCNVLEIGCADGGNLLPMACHFPSSRFVGVDLSPVQIAMGQRNSDALKLANVHLLTADVLTMKPEDLGPFHYIIVHGVYSWVPQNVREAILRICRDHLADEGVAYISYNTFPGWKAKQALRDMLRFHTREIQDLSKKVEAACELINVLPFPESTPQDPAALVIQRLRMDLKQVEDPATYLIHEYLVDINQPFYFTEFLEQLSAAGLQYVDDAYPGSASLTRLPGHVQEWIRQRFSDEASQQQYIDLLGNVSFRRSIVCRADQKMDREVVFDRYQNLHVTASCRKEDSPTSTFDFRTDSGRRFTVEHELIGNTLAKLVEAWPESRAVSEIHAELGTSLTHDELASTLEGLLLGGAIELFSNPTPCVRTVDEFPWAIDIVRQQATAGRVSSASHKTVKLDDPLERVLLESLNGRHRLEDLIALLRQRLTPNEPLSDEQWRELTQNALERFAMHGLLSRSPESTRQD